MDNFDASKVLQNRPWIERALEGIAPQWALKRLESRVQKALFEYNAAHASRIYAPKTYGQPAESPRNQRDRIVMMWEARDLVENFPEAREVTRKFGNYLTPHEYSPTTGDRDYNNIVSDYFHSWCKRADITGRHSFKKLVQVAAEERSVDGDCGFVIRRLNDELKIQLVSGTRIGNPNQIANSSDNYYQGIVTNDFGQPTAYRIYRIDINGVYFDSEDIPAQNFCHYFDPFRIDQYRGVTDFHAAIRTARMLYEILEAEKAGVRFSSQQAALIYSDRGVANPRNLFHPPTQQPTVLPSGQQQHNEYSDVGTIRYFGSADRIEVMPSRPSQAFTGFVQHLMHEIALGVGIPEGVLFGTQDYKGPSVRAEFAAADRVFARHQGVLSDKVLDPIKDAVILDGIARNEISPPPLLAGETMVQALHRATKGEWRFPAKLSIDVGRESAANLNENRQGAKSLQEIAAEQGTDAFGRLEQIAIEASYVKELAQKYAIPETAIRLVTTSFPTTPSAATAAGEAVGIAAADATATSRGQTVQPIAEPIPQDQTPAEDISQNQSEVIAVNFSDNTYLPTNLMAANAEKALKVRELKPLSERGITSVGILKAKDIISKKALNENSVKRMKSFFDRYSDARKDCQLDDKTWQAWNAMGGDEGYIWAKTITDKLNYNSKKEITELSKNETSQPNSDEWLDVVMKYKSKLSKDAVKLKSKK